MSSPGNAILRVVGPAAMKQQMDAADKAFAEQNTVKKEEPTGLAAFIRSEFSMMQQHRNAGERGWSQRLLNALRVFNGVYDPTKLAEIQKFGGSDVYARLTSMKCRGTSSLLRDVYLSPERAWGIEPPDDPQIPESVMGSIKELIASELGVLQQGGQPPNLDQIRDRTNQLVMAARQAAKKKAGEQAAVAEDKLDTILKEGGFYKAVAEMLVDLPLFPFACIKGPTVRIVPEVQWKNGTAAIAQTPKLFWQRVSPFDLWWTPGVADIEDAAVIERTRLTRTDLNDLLDLPGYNKDAILAVLDEYGRGGLNEDWDTTDSERSVMESREDPTMNRSGMITCLAYTGSVQGRMLLEYGMKAEQIPDPLRDYYVQCWLIGRHIIKVQHSPSPRKRHAYYITSFEKVPGTPVGNALPDILSDIQDVANATLRSLVNNLSISSGPQVVVNDDRLAPGENGEDLYPWKRWHMTSDPLGTSSTSNKPVDFFQPSSNAQELLAVFQAFSNMADDYSAIPKYLQGSGAGGGAGRTASGLAMLMGNASKILQTVAANIDRDIYEPALGSLFDMVMLTDTSGLLTGEEKIRVLGVSVAQQRETQRARQLEFLQITANPADMAIIGPRGRADVLRAVANTIGLNGDQVVPTDDELMAQQRQAQEVAQMQAQPGHAPMGQPPVPNQAGQGAPGNQSPQNVNKDQGPRHNAIGGGP